jgi:hypothetical protein
MDEEVVDRMERALQNTLISKYFFSLSIPYLLNAIFLILSLYKLQFHASLSWTSIFCPFFAADIWSLVQKVLDLCSPSMPMWHPKKTKAVLQTLDSVSNLFLKLAIYMDIVGLWDLTSRAVLVCIPLWLCALCSGYYRCRFSNESEFSMLVGSAYNFVSRCLQPLLIALQVDEKLKQPWMVVMTPTWTILILCFSGALFLAYCSPIIRFHALERLHSQATLLLLLCCSYLLAISCCGFLFVFWAAERMDFEYNKAAGQRISVLQIVLPMIILQILLAFIQPAISAHSRRFQLLSQINSNIIDNTAGCILKPRSDYIWLYRDSVGSSGYIFRKTESSYGQLGFLSHEALMNKIMDLVESDSFQGLLNYSAGSEAKTLIQSERSAHRQYNTFDQLENGCTEKGPSKNTSVPPSSSTVDQTLSTVASEEISRLKDTIDFQSELGIYEPMIEDEELCLICYTGTPDTCLMSCGHGGLCFDCACKVARKRTHECPICRGSINQVIRLNPKSYSLQSLSLERSVTIFSSRENFDVILVHDATNISEGLDSTSRNNL